MDSSRWREFFSYEKTPHARPMVRSRLRRRRTPRSYRLERGERSYVFLFFFVFCLTLNAFSRASATTLVIERSPKVRRSTFVHAQRTRTTPRVLVATRRRRRRRVSLLLSSCRHTFFSAKVASRARLFRSYDDADDNDDDDDDDSSSGRDAVIQYGSLHTCQNKRTENERARSGRILRIVRPSRFFFDGTCRRDASTGVAR